jgi:GNAT superfamily N-acetyltransferase
MEIELLADRPDLIPPLAALRWREWDGEPDRADLAAWVDVTAAEAGRDTLPVTFVAVDGAGRAVGGVGLAPHDPPERSDRGPWVVGMIVRPGHRGHGTGGALMTHLAGWAGRSGYARLWVATGGPAVAFYRRCGWTVHEVFRRDSGEQVTILGTPTPSGPDPVTRTPAAPRAPGRRPRPPAPGGR